MTHNSNSERAYWIWWVLLKQWARTDICKLHRQTVTHRYPHTLFPKQRQILDLNTIELNKILTKKCWVFFPVKQLYVSSSYLLLLPFVNWLKAVINLFFYTTLKLNILWIFLQKQQQKNNRLKMCDLICLISVGLIWSKLNERAQLSLSSKHHRATAASVSSNMFVYTRWNRMSNRDRDRVWFNGVFIRIVATTWWYVRKMFVGCVLSVCWV